MKKFKSYILVAMMGLSVASCKDFLTLMPLNEVVLENFWTNKDDVESVLMGAYAALETSDCVVRMSIWGEMRSDNIVGNSTSNSGGANSSESSGDDIIQICKDNILQTNTYTTYKCFYDVINRANTVLHFAPEVAAKDPNYTGAELKANEAEAIALRCLCYWYLIRAYKDVPYTTIPSIDDTHDFFIGQTPFAQVLDSLINDLDHVKNMAVNRYALESYNTGRFTRASIYAMLADLYLWKGDWDKCIECCEWVTARKLVEYEELLRKEGKNCTVELINNTYPLISETPTSAVCGNAYNEIFGKGNSFETLFELPFDQDRNNPFVSNYYNSKNSKVGKLKAYTEIGNGFGTGSGNKVFIQPFDVRYYQNVRQNGSDYGIVKYVFEKMEYNMSDGQIGDNRTFSDRQNTQPNWIVYRYTDVLLMEAEAKVMKARSLGAGEEVAPQVKNLLEEAFNLVDAVNRRAICKDRYESAKELKLTDYNGSITTMEELVLDERRRELMFEGKRWFDLVRLAMREGDTKRVVQKVVYKHDAAQQSAVRIKLSDMNALFFPINKDEIKINNKLVQNPVYEDDEYIEKAK
ncbi:MAG: RagB/SusD family nutrient uptake outer membrane protein [Bacteroidaceae bacterium]